MSYALQQFTQQLIADGIPISGVSLQNDPPTNIPSDITIRYQESATQDQITQGNAAISSFNWNMQPPSVSSFITAIRAEPTFTSEIRIGLAGLLGLLQMDVSNSIAAQQDWDDAVATYGSSWLTSAVQTKVLDYASQYDIPIHA
jgi:hypothetical protein